jgi:hypothetical protein
VGTSHDHENGAGTLDVSVPARPTLDSGRAKRYCAALLTFSAAGPF